ncbi:myotubularin-related protein 14 [Coccinella septempunctata]|uniref:myotubularin-related protein 14 n=1 Tax=Coccinella septempunctata TaxID=41139 RepID=UPI001D064FC3|nr:myotubularin-related protein 14 [Coccinella septempunctata]
MDCDPLLSIKRKEIENLCNLFKQNAYSVCYETPEATEALARCKALLELDYKVVEINNSDGALCSHYPSKILICQSELPDESGNEVRNEALSLESTADVNQLRNQILKARKGRCRARFPVPVIFYKGKNICRSGTTAHFVEILGRATVETFNSYLVGTSEDELEGRGDEHEFNDDQNLNLESSVRKNDIQLLKTYNVESIFDLMVEQKKIKYGVYVTSSETADEENRYSEFKIYHIPYPGCEFFTNINNSDRKGIKQYFDWTQRMVDKIFDIPDLERFSNMRIDWDEYRTWDIVQLTRNYLMLILKQVHESKSGILVHCISGWDRTPLFISLIRLSLWADGLIHKSLNVWQIIYFTVAYDWMFFGHNLKNRLEKTEEIFFFCFYVLKHLTNFEMNNSGLVIHSDDTYQDNGNPDTTLRKPNISSPTDVLPDYRDYQTGINEEDVLSDTELDRDFYGLETPSSPSSNESNGNNICDPGSDLNGGAATARSIPKPSSPVPIKRNSSASDTDTSGSWAYVTTTGSVRSREEMSHRNTRRHRRLHGVRNEFYRMYYHCIPVSYKQGTSVIGQVLGNLSERVGFS